MKSLNEAGKYEVLKKKLDNICEKHNLVWHIYTSCYPVQMVFQPLTDMDSQMSMLEQDEGYISPNAKLTLIMQNGDIEEKTEGRTQWPKTLKDKLFRLFKNMYLCYVEYFHRNLMERNVLNGAEIPVISEDDVPEEYEADDEVDSEDEAEDAASAAETPQISILADKATKLSRIENKASTGLLQRRMNVDATTAGKIIDALIERGVISADCDAAGVHEVLPWDEPDDEV